ncbi:hypothetical protein C7H19_06575 [Aphanothece hegewaldii CCALA 016]|uniref:AbrB family transcriptional regulator n=1 Tax=Aphanothece hegewaldii CCALA 016 TaxID=2107694 RepID=A0A2T1M0D5_9CHRO|nr:hypothetical protein [Aphanothece hegewaldii]PSF38130.1 hypothetical protein C7H19_06575 [Aphanothece hegewaldii CCALA 016]
MESSLIATVTPEGNLELPSEIRKKIQAGEKFIVTLTEDTITLEKMNKFDWDDWEKRVEKAREDIEPMTIEEICEIVREVRRGNLY